MGKTCSCEVNYCYGKDPNEFNLDEEQGLVIYTGTGKDLDRLNYDTQGDNLKSQM